MQTANIFFCIFPATSFPPAQTHTNSHHRRVDSIVSSMHTHIAASTFNSSCEKRWICLHRLESIQFRITGGTKKKSKTVEKKYVRSRQLWVLRRRERKRVEFHRANFIFTWKLNFLLFRFFVSFSCCCTDKSLRISIYIRFVCESISCSAATRFFLPHHFECLVCLATHLPHSDVRVLSSIYYIQLNCMHSNGGYGRWIREPNKQTHILYKYV